MFELPTRSQDRVNRQKDATAHTSLLSVSSHAALTSIGFNAIGDVQGSFVLRSTVGERQWGQCASQDHSLTFVEPQRVIFSDADRKRNVSQARRVSTRFTWNYPAFHGGSSFGRFDRHLAWLRLGWNKSLERILQECQEIGGDGVIGVTAIENRFDDERRFKYTGSSATGRREFTLTGTAVRSKGNNHSSTPFATTLSGVKVAKLVQGGYFPAGLIIGVVAAMRHNDYETVKARRIFAGNVEVPGLSELMTGVRSELRNEIGRRTESLGADGSLLESKIKVELDQEDCDLVAQAMVLANAVIRIGDRTTANKVPLSVLPVRP